MQADLTLETDVAEGRPRVRDVTRRPPGIGIHGVAPGPYVGHTVLAQGIEDVTGLLAQVLLHLHIRTGIGCHRMVPVGIEDLAVAAPVVFQVVHAPLVPGLGVLPFVVQCAEIASAGAVARAGIDAHLETIGMQPRTERLDVRELLVRDDAAVRSALFRLPGIVDVHVGITVVRQAAVDEGGRGGHHLLLRDAQAPAVPRVPTHRRGQGDLALRILRDKDQRIVPLLGDTAAEHTLIRVQRDSLGKAFHGVFHGLFARESEPEDDRRTGPDAEHQRSVVPRGGGRRWRQDIRSGDRSRQRLLELVVRIGDLHALLSLHVDAECDISPRGNRSLPLVLTDDLIRQHILRYNLYQAAGGSFRVENRLILPVLAFQVQADEILQRRLADEGRTLVETAGIATVIDTDGNHVLLVPFDELRFHGIAPGCFPIGDIAFRIIRSRSRLPDPRSVEPSFVAVVDGAQIQQDLVRGTLFQERRNDHMDAVPAESVRNLVPLLIPVLFQRQDRPVAVVESSLAPGGIVPFLETAFVYGNLCGCQDGPSQPQRDHQQKLLHNQVVYQFVTSPV